MYFDHCYRVLPKPVFEEAKQLLKLFKYAEHRKNVTKTMTWEGLYFYAQSGAYLEFIQESDTWKPEWCGFAFSSFGENALYEDIVANYPSLSWDKSLVYRPNGNPWFDCTMLQLPNDPWFMWCLDYIGDEKEFRKKRAREEDNNFLGMSNLTMHASEQLFHTIEQYWQWCSKSIVLDRNKKNIQVPQKYDDEFNLKINESNKINDFEFFIKINPIDSKDIPQTQHLSLEYIEGVLKISYSL